MYCRLLRLVKEGEFSFIPLNKTNNSTAKVRVNEMTWGSATSLIRSSTVGLLPAKYQIALTTKTLIFWRTSSLTPCYSRPTYHDLRRTQIDQSTTFCLAFRNSPVQILEAYRLFRDCLQSCSGLPRKFSDSSNREDLTETFRTFTIAMTCH